jgi:CRISPR-associated RAMP protein, csm3 family
MKQIAQKKLTGLIIVKTGLHIGAGNDKVEIGGMDNPIIRNPMTREPYIPGSSLKGKMRALLEWQFDKVMPNDGKPCSCGAATCEICRVFGSANSKKNNDDAKKRGPTRLIVRDAVLHEDDAEKFKNGKPIIEEKSENSLNRITAAANPRPIERVVPGIRFRFELVYRVIDDGDGGKRDEEYFKTVVCKGLQLLENDYLGGGGSRGNGRIVFAELQDESGNSVDIYADSRKN